MFIYNSLSRKKENFEPINAPFVGLYVCGPTVYGEAHLGHARPAITFDVLYRYLKFKGFKVRYVRNITDVGHLENDADEGEDKIAKKARLEALEPMEISQYYTNNYHENMQLLNVLPPSIEPRASGHIIEQIELIKVILNKGLAYESNGSVYFDVPAYSKLYNYGILSGRVIEDLLSTTRELDGQDEKRSRLDFALWKKANPEHIMRWPSPWSGGFPGWHLECSAMSSKYLGTPFDIHGGGMDLIFPHHECEIAQSQVGFNTSPAKYWMHNNMITINGQKMGKSLGNFITLHEFFSGKHPLLTQQYSPMTVRFFILQAQYRSTLDFSNEALVAAEKGLERLIKAYKLLDKLKVGEAADIDLDSVVKSAFDALDDDLNTPLAIASLFDCVRTINSAFDGKISLSENQITILKKLFDDILFTICGVKEEIDQTATKDSDLMNLILELRSKAKQNKDYSTSDFIRDSLAKIGVAIKDRKEGTDWEWR